jgi:hypothetical protein
MIIKSFGCSFIFGTDLGDNPEADLLKGPVGQFSQLTWPALLAQKQELEYVCHARPGSGNLQIAERVLNQCQYSEKQFFIIGWTWTDRFDYVKSQDPWQPWGTLRPSSSEEYAESYYKNLHSEYQDKLFNLLVIKSVIDVLLEKHIGFIMTYQDELMFDQQWNMTQAVQILQEFIKPHMTKFDGQTFLNWSRSNKYPESETWHPLEQAHKKAADLLDSKFLDQLGRKSC